MSNVDNFLKYLKESKRLKHYHELEKEINENPKFKNEILKLKQLQKRLVMAKDLNKTSLAKISSDDYEQKIIDINKNPRLFEYLELQREYNEILQDLKNIFEDKIDEILNF